jgi:hypothetical protein
VSGDSPACEGQPDELDEVKFHWGDAYDIDASSGTPTARRRDRKDALLTGSSLEDLQLQIKADYQAMPVARDTPVNGESQQQTTSGADADLGGQFHPDYPVVLRAVLFAVDSHGAKVTTGVPVAEAAR